jgi:hypothetical protein
VKLRLRFKINSLYKISIKSITEALQKRLHISAARWHICTFNFELKKGSQKSIWPAVKILRDTQ